MTKTKDAKIAKVICYLLGFTVFKLEVKFGTKTQTIRKIRKFKGRPNPCKVGYLLRLYWHLRKKDCELLRSTPCTETFFISMQFHEYNIGFNYRIDRYEKPDVTFPCYTLLPDEALELAHRDGFNSILEMLQWFKKVHPEELKHGSAYPQFQVIRWGQGVQKCLIDH